MSENRYETPEGGLARDADMKVLLRYYWDNFTKEWTVDVMAEGLNSGEEVEHLEEILENALSLVRKGEITFGDE